MRTVRVNTPGVVYHLIWRFVDHRWFFTNDGERSFYLRLLGNALSDSDWRCLAYALMSNHIHLGMVAGTEQLASWSRRVHTPFALWMNQQRGGLGPLMADRPKDFAILPANEGALIAYIHNNPVRAGVVDRASASGWTSHRAYINDRKPPGWLYVEEGLARAGFDERARFDEWIDRTPGESGEIDLATAQRTVARRGAIQLGTPTTGSRVPLMARPGAHFRPDPKRIVELTSEILEIPHLMIRSRRRSGPLTAARRVVAHCGRASGILNVDIAAALGISHQAISKLARTRLTTRQRRASETVFERLWNELESAKEQAAQPPGSCAR